MSRINSNVARDLESAWIAESSTDSSARIKICKDQKLHQNIINLIYDSHSLIYCIKEGKIMALFRRGML